MIQLIVKGLIPLAALFLTCALGTSCSKSDNENEPQAGNERVLESSVVIYQLRPYKEPCQTNPRDFCLIADQEDQTVRRLYSSIEGLEFKWGNAQTVEVQADRIEDVSGGPQRYRYTLIRMLSDIPATTDSEFDITVDQNDIAASENCQFQIPDEVTFAISDTGLCTTLNEALRSGQPHRLLFRFTGEPDTPIALKDVLSPIVPAKPRAYFFSETSLR